MSVVANPLLTLIQCFHQCSKMSFSCLKTHFHHSAQDLFAWRFAESNLCSLAIKNVSDGWAGKVPNAIFSVISPTPLKAPRLVAVSELSLSSILDMHPSITASVDFTEFAVGNKILPGSLLLSHRYGGHQFGYWGHQLGDGRAVILGEYVNEKGERWELQLKGSGRTPYSRFGDGRAVLRSSIREFLCSEHMFALNIPTSRALSVAMSDSTVIRDMFYDGTPKHERTAVVLRLAPSWFRIGSLEIHFYEKEFDLLRQLTDFLIRNHFARLLQTTGTEIQDSHYVAFFAEVMDRTVRLVADWMAVGFAHGVCNTDNFSLLGLTIDYGPFGFQESFDPFLVPNSSDDNGRYAFSRQPEVARYNLDKLRIAMEPLFITKQSKDDLKGILSQFSLLYKKHYVERMCRKLGFSAASASSPSQSSCSLLIDELLAMMAETSADYTMTFRDLSDIPLSQLRNSDIAAHFWSLRKLSKHSQWKHFVDNYVKLLEAFRGSAFSSDEQRRDEMRSVNPRYVLRNWMAESAIRKADAGDFSEVQTLLGVLTNPFVQQPVAELAGYSRPAPSWAANLRVSCSS